MAVIAAHVHPSPNSERLIKAFLPKMREQKRRRIIQLGLIVSHVSWPVIGWYAASKHAIKALMDALRSEVRQFGIQVVMIEPGASRSCTRGDCGCRGDC